MFRVRTTKTASGKTAVQVVQRYKSVTKIIKHVGSAKDGGELKNLLKLAHQYIVLMSGNLLLFPDKKCAEKNHHLISVENVEFTDTHHNFAYEFLNSFYKLNGFNLLKNNLLRDLSIVRIIEPCSKLRSAKLLKRYFDIDYSKNAVYNGLKTIRLLKSDVQRQALKFAKKHLSFDFAIVFYDVSTLYFDAKKDDELRKYGYSKDGKHNKPQILIALVVTKVGYPIAFDIFEGNKFEGHTIIPVILDFKKTHRIKNLTVIADAAMISKRNIAELVRHDLNYIVAARMSNIPLSLIEKASKTISQKENIYFKKYIDDYGHLICNYSKKRAVKDKSDRKKQIVKAKSQIKNPSKVKRRSRFTKEVGKSKYTLNKELIKKDELLDGIKGYYTNLKKVKEELIVSRYKDLWHIEKAFRIAKSDLLARPIFHWKRKSIEAHILIVFVSLCITKSIEITTRESIREIKDRIWNVLDIKFEDKLTKQKFTKRMNTVPKDLNKIMKRLSSTY